MCRLEDRSLTNDRVCRMQIDETNRWILWAFGDQAEDRMGRFSASAHCVSHGNLFNRQNVRGHR